MGYITPKNFSKTPTNTLQKPPKNTSKYPPKPSQNTPNIFPTLLVFSFFRPEAVDSLGMLSKTW